MFQGNKRVFVKIKVFCFFVCFLILGNLLDLENLKRFCENKS